MSDLYAAETVRLKRRVAGLFPPGYLAGVVAFAIALSVWLHPELKGADTSRYLYWTRSLFFDRDLLLINEFELLGERLLLTPTGYAHEFHNFGTALFWLPFYGLAYGIDSLLLRPAAGRTGYEPVYILLINFSSWVYAGLALILMQRLARRYSRPQAAGWAAGCILLGTSFFYYVAFLPVSSHMASLFLAALFLLMWDADRRQPHWQRGLALGIIGGGLLLVANYNLPYLLLPLFSTLADGYQHGWRRSHWQVATVYALAVGVTYSPQLFISWLYFGHPLASPYAGQLAWFDLYKLIFLTWFSGWHGLFVFSPLIFLVLPGLYYLFKRDKLLAASLAFVFLAFSGVINANLGWPAGTSFGARYFISLAPLFGLSLAVWLDRFDHWLAYLAAGALALWTVLLYAQTALGLINLHTWYSLAELAAGQIQAVRQLPALMAEAHLPATSGSLGGVVAGLALASAVFGLAGPLLVNRAQGRLNGKTLLVLPGCVVILLAFIAYAGINSQAARSRLEAQGYYQGKQLIYHADPLDAMKNYDNLANFYLAQGQPERAEAILQAAFHVWPNQARQLIRPESLAQSAGHPFDLNFGDVVGLKGYTLAKTGAGQVQVSLFWQRLAAQVDEVTYTFQLTDVASGLAIAQYQVKEGVVSPGVLGVYPVEHIPDGLFFSDAFEMPSSSGGFLQRLTLSMAAAGLFPRLPDGTAPPSVTIGFADLSPSGLLYPVNYNFDRQIALTGYQTRLDPARQNLALALRWRAINPPAKNYKVFIHLVDANDRIITQGDGEPLSGLRPTSTWQAGEEILDVVDMALPPDVPLEMASLLVGFYLFETGERLVVIDSQAASALTSTKAGPEKSVETFARLPIR